MYMCTGNENEESYKSSFKVFLPYVIKNRY